MSEPLRVRPRLVNDEDGPATSDAVTTQADESFDDAFRRLVEVAHRVAFRVLGVAADAEDVAAETMARASIRWNRLRPPVEPWVATVASRLAIDRQRKAWRNLPYADEVLAGRRLRPADDGVDLATHLDLVHAVADLSKRQRQVVGLRYLSGYTEAEVAELLGCSASSVQTHTRRGLDALRKRLSSDVFPDQDTRPDDSTTPQNVTPIARSKETRR